MNKHIKVVLLILACVGIITGGVYWFILRAVDVDMSPSVSSHVIEFEELNQKVYLRAMSWGISGNHNEVILSTNPVEPSTRKSEEGKDYIFYTSEVYYKKQGIDTLLVYAESSSIGKRPNNFSGSINVVPVELKTYSEVQDYEKRYKEYGLSKISVYQD